MVATNKTGLARHSLGKPATEVPNGNIYLREFSATSGSINAAKYTFAAELLEESDVAQS